MTRQFCVKNNPITEAEVHRCQKKWTDAILTISKAYKNNGDYIGAAEVAAGKLYGYGHSKVMLKPTRGAQFPFRPTANEALSYFLGGNVVKNGYQEDTGFAINGGKGWSKIEIKNHDIDLNGNVAIAMGEYFFTCETSNENIKVEYTFGYKRNEDGKIRIFLHHSSMPYNS